MPVKNVSEKREGFTILILTVIVLSFILFVIWGLKSFYNFIGSHLPFPGWVTLLLILLIILSIYDYRRDGSMIKSIKTGKVPWIGILITIGIILLVWFIGIPWWNRVTYTPPTPTSFTSHSVTSGTLQTQHVSTAPERAMVPASDMKYFLRPDTVVTFRPGEYYVWYMNKTTHRYWLPVDCNTKVRFKSYTKDNSSGFMYESERNAYGKIASEGSYDVFSANRLPEGYYLIQIVPGDDVASDSVRVKYTERLE